MRSVFADTVYWGALIARKDQYHVAAASARERLGFTRLVTTEEVLTEVLDSLAGLVRRAMSSKPVVVLPQSHESFLAGLRLYESRADKGYSLVDCISMQSMRREQIREVLTNDRHFQQEGFRCLLR